MLSGVAKYTIGVDNSDSDLFGVWVGSTIGSGTGIRLDSSGGVYINDTANAKMTTGLTINQGANDDEILTLKSSDVGHPMTAYTELDTFAVFRKETALGGGLRISGYTDGDATHGNYRAMKLAGMMSSEPQTTKTAGGWAAIDVDIRITDGSTGTQAVGANGNLFAICTNDSVKFIFDADGDYHYDGADGGAFDSYDDASLTRAMAVATGGRGVIRDEWDKYVEYNEQTLVDVGILGDTVANGGLVNGAAMQRLHTGAIWQLNTKHMSLAEEVASLRGDLAIANQKLNALGA